MQTRKLILALSIMGLAGTAQAATWTLGATTVGGLRIGAVSFDGLPAGVEIGNLTDDLDDITPAYVAAGSWRSFSASLGGNTLDVGLSHEAHVETVVGGDPAKAAARVLTSAVLENASIGSAVTLSAVALAPASLRQDFILTPELGESAGMPVFVTYQGYYSHDAVLSAGLTGFINSSAVLYLNGVQIDSAVASGVGTGTGYPQTFNARIGDTLTVELLNTTQVGAANLLLNAGAMPEALALGEVGVELTVSPIPEPETYALMLAGLGLVGWMAQRRRSA